MTEKTIQQLIDELVIEPVKAMSAYPVPDASGMLKLDAMENPFSWPDSLLEECFAEFKKIDINRYPDASASKLIAAIRRAQKIPDSLDILLGNGSDELIQMLILALAKPGVRVFSVAPGFVMYRLITEFAGATFDAIDLDQNFDIDIDACLDYIAEHKPAISFFAVPNNPTGNCFNKKDLVSIIEASEGLVVIDEAYTAFTDVDLLGLANEYNNVLVMRTFSKMGFAGLRLGMLFARPQWIAEFNKLRLPYNINVLTQAAATVALENYPLFEEQAKTLRQERESLFNKLSAFTPLKVYPSEANFILVKLLEGNAKAVFESLRQQNILVKCLDGGHPLLENCLRITVGTSDQNTLFLEGFEKALVQG